MRHPSVHLGIAVALPDGLVVPVLRGADERNFVGTARGIGEIADKARAGAIESSDLEGGTFTITNPGPLGALFGTPIIAQPQVAILGVGGVHKRPVVVESGRDRGPVHGVPRAVVRPPPHRRRGRRPVHEPRQGSSGELAGGRFLSAIPLPVVAADPAPMERRPDWLRVRLPSGGTWSGLRRLLRENDLHTVCEEARCPNMAECWGQGTATFMILGDVCTRACGFCAVATGLPGGLDRAEPERVARAAGIMNLRHTVITSVNRDDLEDGGAGVFAATIRAVRERCPDTTIEVLIPDFQGRRRVPRRDHGRGPGDPEPHLETVPRLYRRVRPGARYGRSLDLLERAKRLSPEVLTKTGVMLASARPKRSWTR